MSDRITVPHPVRETVEWVVKDADHYAGLTGEQRDRVCLWLSANGVDPNDVSAADPVSVRHMSFPIGGTVSLIEYTSYLRDQGRIQTNVRPFGPVKFARRVGERFPFGAPC